jgi:hypothetical protein
LKRRSWVSEQSYVSRIAHPRQYRWPILMFDQLLPIAKGVALRENCAWVNSAAWWIRIGQRAFAILESGLFNLSG